MRHARRARRIAVQFKSASNFAACRVQQRRVPQLPAVCQPDQIIQPAKTSPGFVNLKRNIRLSFALRSRAAQLSQPSRSVKTSLLEPFTRAGSCSQETLASTVASTGPATLDRRCGRNVVVPEQYSKRFFCVPIGLYRGKSRPVTARPIPARSAFGGPASANPAAVINLSTSPLWPCPTSTAKAPPGANSRVTSGAIRR